ncbi:efflux transporter outer membrane subunit [Pleomorphomonas sp. PLEO]|uniref:efflux transporter outer membrane subunit n=1 Tax=Pleomorphomonas sp. PLEO TaxID=3239306 RepID=UPI00351ED0F6
MIVKSYPSLRRVAGISLPLLGLLLSGCAVGPDYMVPHLVLPASWSSKSAETPARSVELAHWWERLGDKELNALVEEAVAGNLDVAAAKAKIRTARASERQTNAALFPSADGSSSTTRQKSQGEVRNQFKGGFDSSWELDLFGANARSSEAALYGSQAANEDLNATLLTLIGDVASNYVAARGYQARMALARQSASSQRETAGLTRKKFEAGSASAVDVSNAEGQAASTEAKIPDLQTSYAEAVHRLAVLTGRAPAELDARMTRGGAIPRPRQPVPPGLPADLLSNRPDIRQAEREYAQATAKIGAAAAARYPSISLAGSIATTATSVGDLGKSSTISWSLGPSLSVPIFNAGKLAAAQDAAEATRDQYFVAYKASVLGALEDVENAIVAFRQERIKNGRLADATQSYRKASELAQSLYQSGSSSFLDVLDAERSLYSAEDSLLTSTVAIANNYITLNKALGGGWDGTVDVSKPEVVDTNTGPRLRKAVAN